MIGEVGTVTATQKNSTVWHTVPLTASYADPVVVMGPLSYNGTQPAVVRVRNVTATSFQFQLDEWDYLDGSHGSESVSYVVVERGVHTLENGRILEAGTAGVGPVFQTVSFGGSFSSTPVVVSQIVTTNNPSALVTRQRSIGPSGFQIRLQAQESGAATGSETVSFIALSAGSGTNGVNPYDAGITGPIYTHVLAAVPFSAGFVGVPSIIASMQTTNEADPATLRYQTPTTTGFTVKVEEEQSFDLEKKHAGEAIGFVAFMAGPIYASSLNPPLGTPSVSGTSPANGAAGVMRDTHVAADVHLPNIGMGVDDATLLDNTVLLYPSGSPGEAVVANVNTTAAGDAIVLQPLILLAANTAYTFEVTSGVKDMAGQSFEPFTMSFMTGPQPNGKSGSGTKFTFERVPLDDTVGKYSSLAIGPDGKLYATTTRGSVRRWTINPDGTLSNFQSMNGLRQAEGGDRLAVGLAFDPASTADNLIAWVSHTTYGFNDMPDWGGKITRLSGANLNVVQDYVVNLPRSIRDHVTNSVAFGPDGALYVTQGSNTATGGLDDAWGNRPERLLSSAVLRIDVAALQAGGTLPVDVKTAEGGVYNPFLPGAPVKIYASGLRNAYDLLWHSNGSLYVPTNGSAAGGKTPASVNGTLRPDGTLYTGPDIPALDYVGTQSDYLFRVMPGAGYSYYGHPNPSRGEYVLNGGNSTSQIDLAEVPEYPEGVFPDAKWVKYTYNFGRNISPNGVIEYKSNTFKGDLKGRLLVARYSGGDDILALSLDKNGNIASNGDLSLTIIGVTALGDPLDLVEDTGTGNLYVSEYKGAGQIVLLRPSTGTLAVAKLDENVERMESFTLDADEEIWEPQTYALSQNYPNPFNPTTAIGFELQEAVYVRLEIFDVLGRHVTTLLDAEMQPGTYQAEWDGRSQTGVPVSGGVYLYRLQAGTYSETKTMTLLK